MGEWDYVGKLKKMTNDQLWGEYSKIQSQLEETTKPYAQRSRRKHDGSYDDAYFPDSPAHDRDSPHINPKKRKKPAVGKHQPKKRRAQPFPFQDAPESPALSDKKGRPKKRKREDLSDAARKLPSRNATNARRKPNLHSMHDDLPDDAFDDLGIYSYKKRKLDDSDDDISGSSDLGGPPPQSEYSNLNLDQVMEKLLHYSKKLEEIKSRKLYHEKLTGLQTQVMKLSEAKDDLESELRGSEAEKTVQNTQIVLLQKQLKQKQKSADQRKKKEEERYRQLTEQMNNMKESVGWNLGGDTSGVEKENNDLKTKISQLQHENRDLRHSLTNVNNNGKVHTSSADLREMESQLWLEQKFSKELQGHYKGLVDIVGKAGQVRKDSSDPKLHEKLQKQQQKLQIQEEQIDELKAQLSKKDHEIERLKAELKQSTQATKSSGKRSRKTERKNNASVISSKFVTASGEQAFKDSDISRCIICSSTKGDLQKLENEYYKADQPTRWLYDPNKTCTNLINPPYCMFHGRCARLIPGYPDFEKITSCLFTDPIQQ